MAQEFDFGTVGNETDAVPSVDIDTQSSISVGDQEINDKGLTVEEISDPNKIKVTISDTQAPLVILYGPPACGKTMTLARLTRYLQFKGLTVEPIKTFRPAYDSHYKTAADDVIESSKALLSQGEEMLQNTALSNEQIEDYMASVDDAIHHLSIPVGEASDLNPIDYTMLIVNPSFEEGNTGWTNEAGVSTYGNDTYLIDNELFVGNQFQCHKINQHLYN